MTDRLLDDVAAIQQAPGMAAILVLAQRVSGMGLVAIARVTDTRWMACAVRDKQDFGIGSGTELDLKTTICDETRGHRQAIIIDHVAEDPIYRDHHTPRLYGFQSYISAPIIRADNSFYGTLFGVDRGPSKLANGAAVTAFPLLSQLIAIELDAIDAAKG
jgi:GAF domain-containing protein